MSVAIRRFFLRFQAFKVWTESCNCRQQLPSDTSPRRKRSTRGENSREHRYSKTCSLFPRFAQRKKHVRIVAFLGSLAPSQRLSVALSTEFLPIFLISFMVLFSFNCSSFVEASIRAAASYSLNSIPSCRFDEV